MVLVTVLRYPNVLAAKMGSANHEKRVMPRQEDMSRKVVGSKPRASKIFFFMKSLQSVLEQSSYTRVIY